MKTNVNASPFSQILNRHAIRAARAAALGFLGVTLTGPIPAQAERVDSDPPRSTVPAGAPGIVTNTITLANFDTNNSSTLNLSVDFSGVVGVTNVVLPHTVFVLPPATYEIEIINDQPELVFTPGETNINYTVWHDDSVPQTGPNELLFFATNTTALTNWNYRLPVPFKSAVFWDGETNNVGFSTGMNWQGGAVPTAGDVALFGTVVLATIIEGTNETIISVPGLTFTNTVYTNETPYTNVIVSTDTAALGGLRFAQEEDAYDVDIQSNATLRVTGTEGFQMLGDDSSDQSVRFYGGGNLVISNSAAPFGMFTSGELLDLSGLGTLVVDVDRVCLENFACYPNRFTNGTYNPKGSYGSSPDVYFARSNYIKTAWIGGEAVLTNTGEAYDPRPYAFSIGPPSRKGGNPLVRLGVTNVIYSESILFGGGGDKNVGSDEIRFNTDTNFVSSNVVHVLFIRGEQETNRCAVWASSDLAGPYILNQNSKSRVDLRDGRVDAKVDTFIVGRDRSECGDNDGMNAWFYMGGTSHSVGTIIDANTAYISMQSQGNNNIDPETLANVDGEPVGQVNTRFYVGSNAVFKVNDTLHMGYTTADANDIRTAQQGWAAIYIEGGTLMANQVQVGGITKLSGNDQRHNHLPTEEQNGFTITGGGELIITNYAGQAVSGGRLNGLNMTDSTLTLHVNGNDTNLYVYTKELNTGGAGNIIRIASVANIGSYPAVVPLIAYDSASPNFSVELPSGLYGFVVNNKMSNTIDVVILDTEPANLVWDGPGSWDTASAVWQGGEIFADGDSARFDDTASSYTVNRPAGTLYVGGDGVLITNNVGSYVFNGSGSIGGTSPMNKWGTNSLTMNADSELPLNIHEGSVWGSGGIGATVVNSNTSLTFSGDINRLTTAGTVVLQPGANVANTTTVEAGTVSNSGSINASVIVESNASLTVNPGGAVNMNVPATSTIENGAELVLNGTWQSATNLGAEGTYRLDIFGSLTGTGRILAGQADLGPLPPARAARLNIGSGGYFSPGSGPGHLMTFTNGGRFDFTTDSKVVIEVDMDSADGSNPNGSGPNGSAAAKSSDTIRSDRWSTVRGTLVITNVGVANYAAGTIFKVFKKPFDEFGAKNVPLSNNGELPAMEPASPGPGLLWDLSNLRTNGWITITTTASTPPVLVSAVAQGTNLTFSWPSGYQGWDLQTQVNPIHVGLSNNWTVLHKIESSFDTNLTLTNWLGDPDELEEEIRVYRLAHPSFD
jgi:hypothetical protein